MKTGQYEYQFIGFVNISVLVLSFPYLDALLLRRFTPTTVDGLVARVMASIFASRTWIWPFFGAFVSPEEENRLFNCRHLFI